MKRKTLSILLSLSLLSSSLYSNIALAEGMEQAVQAELEQDKVQVTERVDGPRVAETAEPEVQEVSEPKATEEHREIQLDVDLGSFVPEEDGGAEETPATEESEVPKGPEAPKEEEVYDYIGYSNGTAGVTQKLYVEKKDGSSEPIVVYCFNKSLAWPVPKNNIKDLAYRKTTGSVEDFEGKVHELSAYKGEELIEALKIVLTNGYPNSAIIKKSLGLTDDQFREVTQRAVWHFTDREATEVEHIQGRSSAEALAFSLLVNRAGSKILRGDVLPHYLEQYQVEHPEFKLPDLTRTPENATLDLYIHNNADAYNLSKHYQHLLSAHLIDKTTHEIIPIPGGIIHGSDPTYDEIIENSLIEFEMDTMLAEESGSLLKITLEEGDFTIEKVEPNVPRVQIIDEIVEIPSPKKPQSPLTRDRGVMEISDQPPVTGDVGNQTEAEENHLHHEEKSAEKMEEKAPLKELKPSAETKTEEKKTEPKVEKRTAPKTTEKVETSSVATKAPKTGDGLNVALYLGLIVFSGALIVVIELLDKRRAL